MANCNILTIILTILLILAIFFIFGYFSQNKEHMTSYMLPSTTPTNQCKYTDAMCRRLNCLKATPCVPGKSTNNTCIC